MFEFKEMNINDYENSIELWKQTEGMGFLESDTIESLNFAYPLIAKLLDSVAPEVKITSLSSDCPILTWDCSSDTQWTIDGSKMLYYWNITDSVRIYKHAN